MATPAMPSAPSAPAAPAAAPAAPAAPSTPATPATPSAPASQPSAASPAPAAAPAAATAPKNTDFPNTPDGQVAFLSALKKFEKDNPAKPGEGGAAAAAAVVTADDKAAAAQLGAQPGEAAAAAEAAKPAAPDAAAPTPQALADLMQKKPEFGKLLDADPELKGPIFAMARDLAAAKPIMEMFPTVGDAQFAQQNAQELVGLKTMSLRAVDRPETVPELLGAFDQQFAVVDKDGKPVLDAQGKPTYAADRKVFQDALVGRDLGAHKQTITPQIEQLQAKLKNGVYPHEAAKALDQKKLDNLEYAQLALQVVDQIRSGEWFEDTAPEIPADASPEFRTWAEQEKARLDKQKQDLAGQKQGANAEQRAQQRQQFQTAVRGDMGTTVGTMIGQKLKEITDSGVYLPEFYLQERYRDQNGKETSTSAIAAKIFLQFENELQRPGSRTLMEITQHELLPENEQTRAIRKEWYAKRAADIVPRLVQAEVDRIQKLVKVDQEKQKARQAERSQAAQPEPNTAGSGLPQGASEQQLRTQAEEQAKKHPEYAGASAQDRQAMIVTQYNRLRGGPGRK